MGSISATLIILLFSSLCLHSAIAELICEELPTELCAFSIASSGKRCLLETEDPTGEGHVELQCRTSEVVVERMSGYVETNQCVADCGVDRSSVGISSDALLEPQFSGKLCSDACFGNCPNIVDLYFNLAAGEGAFLPDLCEAQRTNPHRAMLELLSSGGAAPGPVSAELTADFAAVPAPSPIPSF